MSVVSSKDVQAFLVKEANNSFKNNQIIVDIYNKNRDRIHIARDFTDITISEFVSFLNLLDMQKESFCEIQINFNNKSLLLRS